MEWMALLVLACSVASSLLALLILAAVDCIACLPLWSTQRRKRRNVNSSESESGRV